MAIKRKREYNINAKTMHTMVKTTTIKSNQVSFRLLHFLFGMTRITWYIYSSKPIHLYYTSRSVKENKCIKLANLKHNEISFKKVFIKKKLHKKS